MHDIQSESSDMTTFDDDAVEFDSVDVRNITSGSQAFSMLCDGSLSLAKYEEWAVCFFRWPSAAHCDFRRYTKCVELEETTPREISQKVSVTPCYKKRSSKKNVVQRAPRGCSGTPQDFDELCSVFRNLVFQ